MSNCGSNNRAMKSMLRYIELLLSYEGYFVVQVEDNWIEN
jgi:hypothetical protein